MLGGVAGATMLGALIAALFVLVGGFGASSWLGRFDRFMLLVGPAAMCGFFGSGFGVIAAAFSEGRCHTWKSAAWGMSIPGLIFVFLAFSGGEFRSPGYILATLAVLLLPGAVAGIVAARIMSKGHHGTP